MRIWIISEGEPLPIDGQAVRLRRMGQLSKILIQQGHEVHWFSSTYHHYKKEERYSEDTDLNINENMYFHLLKGVSYRQNVSFARIIHHKRIAEKFTKRAENLAKPDVIIATMAPLELSKVATEYAKSNSIPVVIDIRDLWPEIYSEVVPNWGKKFIIPYINREKKRLRKILTNATALVGVTEGFLNYGLSIAKREKTKLDAVFHTSYKTDSRLSLDFDNDWAKYGLTADDFIITFMGNFGKQFELEMLYEVVEKFRDYPEIKFVFCGVGEKFEFYQKKAEKLPNIIMPGWIEGNQIASLLSNSDIGIAPYRDSKNFRLNAPNKFGEYLSYGLPIIVSISGQMEILLNQYDCGMQYSNKTELFNSISQLYNDKTKLNYMKKNAEKLYNELFNSEKVYIDFTNYLINLSKKQI